MKKNLILFFVILLQFSAVAQNGELFYRFEHLSNQEGLSQNSISSIVQDKKGFIWIGTYDGLNRYDGYNIKLYRNDPNLPYSIADNYIKTLLVDHKGRVWVGTKSEGISLYFPEENRFKTIRKDRFNPNGLSTNEVNVIFEDNAQRLWVGTSKGLNLLENDKEEIRAVGGNEESIIADESGILTKVFRKFYHNPKNAQTISGNIINDITNFSLNKILIATENGISEYNSNSEKFKTIYHSPAKKIAIKGLKLFIANDKGFKVLKYDGTRVTDELYNIDIRNINSFAIKNDSIVWVATTNGLQVLNIKTKKYNIVRHNPLEPNSLSVNNINCIFFDRTNVAWIGTQLGGINKWDPGSKGIELYRKNPFNKNSLSSNRVRSIFKDEQKNLFIGTVDSGLNIWNLKSNTFTHYFHNPKDKYSLPNNHVRVIFEDSKKRIWLGTEGGICIFNRKKKNFTKIEIEGLLPKNEKIWDITEDYKKAIWIASFGGGLIEYFPVTQKAKLYQRKPSRSGSLSDNRVTTVFEDDSHRLWVGTFGGGLQEWDRYSQTFKHYRYSRKEPKTISNNRIYSIFEDSKHDLWIGTKAGLNKFQPKEGSFIRFTESNGLPNNVVMGIIEDKKRNLWLSTNNGIAKLSLTDYSIKSYDVNDGLQSNEFLVGSYFKDLNGKVYFGGINGLNVFYPGELTPNQFVPQVAILDFKLFNKSISNYKNKIIEGNISYSKEINLNYNQNVFSIEFAALHFSQPMKNNYQFQLYPFDKSWVKTNANHRYATYTNIEPGEYIFRVIGSNSDGIWNEEGVTLKINITPPLWQKTWFRILIIVIILLGIFFWYRSHINRIKNQKIALEEEVNKRTQEIEEKNKQITKQSKELEKLSWVAQETQNAVIIMSPTGEIEWVNLGFKRLFGYRLGEWVKHKSLNIIGPKTSEKTKKAFNTCIQEKSPVTYELIVTHKEGMEVYIQANLVPILSYENDIIKIVAVDSDITGLKKAEVEIRAQKEELEENKKQLEYQNRQIEIKNENIKGSIRYALTLQKAVLPTIEHINKYFSSFVFYSPKDIVSGDFYWFHKTKDKDEYFIAVGDCTGHGVPGAFMSIIANNLLNEIIIQEKNSNPSNILTDLDTKLVQFLKQDQNENTDGIDIALLKLEKKGKQLNVQFSGSKRPVAVYRNTKRELQIYKGSRKSIGGMLRKRTDVNFTNQDFTVSKNDIIYLFSDGIVDQNNLKRKKFGSSNFFNLLLQIGSQELSEQKETIKSTLINHMIDTEQRDDITILALKFDMTN